MDAPEGGQGEEAVNENTVPLRTYTITMITAHRTWDEAAKLLDDYSRTQFDAGWRARGEADTEKIRQDCGACGGTGYSEAPILTGEYQHPGEECEYCGRPQDAIKDMPIPAAQPAEEYKDVKGDVNRQDLESYQAQFVRRSPRSDGS